MALALVTNILAYDPGLGAELVLLSCYLVGSCLLRGLPGRSNALGFVNGFFPFPTGVYNNDSPTPNITNCESQEKKKIMKMGSPGRSQESPDWELFRGAAGNLLPHCHGLRPLLRES